MEKEFTSFEKKFKEIVDSYNDGGAITPEGVAYYSRQLLELAKDEVQNLPDVAQVSDGNHTFEELYYYRMLYNAAFFNSLAYYDNWADGGWLVEYDVHKSKRHSDGEECFGSSDWFIVMAELPTGQVSNHYEMKYWDLFNIPEKSKANVWDGHTPAEAAERLRKFINQEF